MEAYDFLQEFVKPIVFGDYQDFSSKKIEGYSGSPDKLPGQSSEYFTFICDNVIVEKTKAIACHEGFPIRQVIELFIIYGIDAYERKHGVAIPNGKDIKDLL